MIYEDYVDFERKFICSFLGMGISVAGGFGAIHIDTQNNLHPHIYDKISPLIENHMGNVPLSMGISWAMMTVIECTYLAIDNPMFSNKLRSAVRKIYPVLALGVIAVTGAANLWSEMQVVNNPELMGDVSAGVLGSILAVGLIRLPGYLYKAISGHKNNGN